jgi:hypothetical protein
MIIRAKGVMSLPEFLSEEYTYDSSVVLYLTLSIGPLLERLHKSP